MPYLPSGSPIFPNRDACLAARNACSDASIQQAKTWSLQGRLASYNTLIDPAQVLQTFGVGAAVHVAKMQNQTQSARATGLVVTTPTTDTTSGGSIPASLIGVTPGMGKGGGKAPTVLPMNPAISCSTTKVQRYAAPAPPAKPMPSTQPSMPARAPIVVETPAGPMNFQGPPATSSGKPNTIYLGPPSTASLPALASGRFMGIVPGQAQGPSVVSDQSRYMSIVYNRNALSGLGGYAPSWGDASIEQQSGAAAGTPDLWGWLSDHPWLALGLAGVGVFAAMKGKGRR